MANRLVINETIAAYANAAIDGANATGGRDAVVEVRNQMRQILGFMATNIDLRLSLDNEAYTAEERQALARFRWLQPSGQRASWSYGFSLRRSAVPPRCFSV